MSDPIDYSRPVGWWCAYCEEDVGRLNARPHTSPTSRRCGSVWLILYSCRRRVCLSCWTCRAMRLKPCLPTPPTTTWKARSRASAGTRAAVKPAGLVLSDATWKAVRDEP